MINKIRKKLVIGYSIAIIVILIASIAAGYMALSRITLKMNQKSLFLYLANEVYESQEMLKAWQTNHHLKTRIRQITAHKRSFNNVVYWYAPDGRLLMAEELASSISPKLREKLDAWNFPSGTLQNILVSSAEGKKPWFFMMISQDIYDDNNTYLGRVIVGTNMSPFASIANKYYLVSALIVLAVSILAFWVGNFFASKAIKPIKISIQKQKEFVADASHELRTPLSILLSSVDILKKNESNRELIADMKNEILNMKHLINDLLVLARSDSEKENLVFEDFNLADCIKSVVRNFQSLAFEKKIDILFSSEECIPFYGDENKIRQLIAILLDNALKYSPEKTQIKVTAMATDGDILIKVKDQGVGIPENQLNKIFERFYRVDKARSRSTGGVGLGLPIAQTIVQAHGGKIKVCSKINEGSVFTVRIPIKSA